LLYGLHLGRRPKLFDMSLALRQSVLFRRILVLFEAARWRRFEGGNGFRSRCSGAVEICMIAFSLVGVLSLLLKPTSFLRFEDRSLVFHGYCFRL